MKLSRFQSFGEDVSWLQGTADVLRSDKTSLKCITNKMTVDLDMFRALVKYRIDMNVNDSLTVIKKWNRLGNQNTEVLKKTIEPLKFTKSSGHRPTQPRLKNERLYVAYLSSKKAENSQEKQSNQ